MRTFLENRKHLYLAIACTCLLLVGGAVASAAVFTGDPHELGGSTPLSNEAAKAFSVFSQPGNSGEDERVQQYVGHVGASNEVDPSSVHLAQNTSAFQVRVAGDAQSVCLVGRIPNVAGSSSCAPVADAANPATPLIQAGYAPEGKLLVTGLFPNGITNVTVTSPSGSSSSVEVVNNTIGVIVDASDAIHWTAPDGHAYSMAVPH
jgi:hypothetical protein